MKEAWVVSWELRLIEESTEIGSQQLHTPRLIRPVQSVRERHREIHLGAELPEGMLVNLHRLLDGNTVVEEIEFGMAIDLNGGEVHRPGSDELVSDRHA